MLMDGSKSTIQKHLCQHTLLIFCKRCIYLCINNLRDDRNDTSNFFVGYCQTWVGKSTKGTSILFGIIPLSNPEFKSRCSPFIPAEFKSTV